jgi:hypothetical protein
VLRKSTLTQQDGDTGLVTVEYSGLGRSGTLTVGRPETIVGRGALKGSKNTSFQREYEFSELIDSIADLYCSAADRGTSDQKP